MKPPSDMPYGMLILTRHPQETLHIGDEITVTVLGVQGNQVRLGIQVPTHVGVHRRSPSSDTVAIRSSSWCRMTTSAI